MFEQSMLNGTARTRRVWTVMVSFLCQMVGIGIAVLIPLIAFDRLPQALLTPRLEAPPRAPRPLAQESRPYVKIVGVMREHRPGVFTAPAYIPTTIAKLVDPPQAPDIDPGGDAGDVIGGLPGSDRPGIGAETLARQVRTLADVPPQVISASKEVVAKPPIRVTLGGVVVQAKLIHKVTPAYPPLARQAHVSGTVRLQAVISRDGRIQSLALMGGHALLVPAALEAVRQWVYSPTLLNGDPVEVLTTIDVIFTLSQ